MKQSCVLMILFALASAAVAQSPGAEALKRVQAHVQARQFAQAVDEAERGASGPDVTPADKARLFKVAAEAAMRMTPPDRRRAAELYERIIADPAIAAAAKIDALKSLADLQVAAEAGKNLHEMDLSAAQATLDRALDLPDLKPNDRAAALKNIGRLRERQAKYDEARAAYERILGLEVVESVKKEAHKLIADTFAAEGRAGEAISLYRQHGIDPIDLYRTLGDDSGRREACLQVLDDPAAAEPARWSAFSRLPCWDYKSTDLAAVREACERYLPAFIASDPNRALVLQRKFFDHAVGKDPGFVEWAAPILLQAPRLSEKDYTTARAAVVEALSAQGKREPAVAAAREMAEDARVAAPMRLWARVVAATPAGGQAVQAVLDGAADASPAEKAEALLGAAKTALRAGDEVAARDLYDRYEALIVRPQRAAIECRFLADAPFDIGSWLASPLLQEPGAKLDRPYGDNLQFLLATDSAVTGRNAGAAAEGQSTGHRRTDFFAACDAEGIHLFFHAHDDRAAEVAAGLLAGGSFEMYLAPGPRQAYYTFLLDLPQGRVDPQGFITMYPNPGFRLPSLEAGTIRTQTRRTDQGFATHLMLSWELFYDKLPADGTRWQFESIRWTRSGGLSFGGSESVHNRSSWGDLVFAGLGPEQLAAIQRRIIHSAVAKYKRARAVTGPVGQWADPILGDPAFFQQEVRPLLDRLDAAAEKVTADLPPELVRELFRDAVPGWMEAPHLVQAMRARYLEERYIGSDAATKGAAR